MTLCAKQGGLQERTSHTYARTHVRTHIMRGRYLSPRVISAYYTPSSKSRRSLTLCNAFLRLRRRKPLDREKIKKEIEVLLTLTVPRLRIQLTPESRPKNLLALRRQPEKQNDSSQLHSVRVLSMKKTIHSTRNA